jgi:Mor family transcriptional regulator
LVQHLCDARSNKSNLPVHRWLRKLLALSLMPILEVLEHTPDRNREAWWIAKYREEYPGAILNILDGGSAPPSTDPAVRAKLRGPKSLAHRQALSKTRRERIAAGLIKGLVGDQNPMRLHPESVLRGSRSALAKVTEEDVRGLRAEYADGATTVDLAPKYGLTQASVWRIVNGLSWQHVGGSTERPRGQGKRPASRTARGEDSVRAKLTAPSVCEIRTRHAAGERVVDLSREYRISDAQVLRIVRGLSWRHLLAAA